MKFCPLCASPLSEKTIDGVERKACPAEGCGFVHWNNPVPVVAALVEREGKIILVRNHGWPEKVFGLITGFLEKGEIPEQGVLREVREETGLEGKIIEFLGNFSFFQANQLLIAYYIRAEGPIEKSEEIEEIKQVPVEKLKGWQFGTGLVIQHWLDRIIIKI